MGDCMTALCVTIKQGFRGRLDLHMNYFIVNTVTQTYLTQMSRTWLLPLHCANLTTIIFEVSF